MDLTRYALILEGPRGCGKTSAAKAVRSKYKSRLHVWDRFVGSCYALDTLWNRAPSRPYLLELEMLGRIYVVRQAVILPDAATLVEGRRQRGDPGVDPNEVARERDIFADWADRSAGMVRTEVFRHHNEIVEWVDDWR